MSLLLNVLDLGLILFAVWLLRKIASGRSGGPLPPGPKPLPIIGNVLDMPTHYPWKTFCEWRQRWGSLVHLDMFGQHLMIINSQKVAVDLLEKKSSIYSDRPVLQSADIIGYSNTVPFIVYGDGLREQRRMLSQTLGSRSQVDKYNPLEQSEAYAYLFRVMHDPENFSKHLQTFTGAVMLLLSYGYKIKRDGRDEMLERAFTSVEDFAEAALPGAYLVDTFPILRFVPAWFPGAKWKRRINEIRHILHLNVEDFLNFTKGQMASGTAISSFVSRNLEHNPSAAKEHSVKWTGSSLLGGAYPELDLGRHANSLSTLNAFYLAMTIYPEIQAKAQAEIDSVIGGDRLPTFDDRARLTYVNAICTELLRWMPVGPLGVPHVLTEDDEYDGYFLPKGSVFIANLWGVLHDPERYPNPEEFSPERFIKTETNTPQEDPRTSVFGYGRRSCPGLYVADATIFILVACSLAVFDVTKRVENGQPITPLPQQTSSTISHPMPFKCTIKPRSAAAEALIRSANESHDPETVLV
ncbi:hypothetical protein NM688_g1644 [Phlebia brevispora]|uniref:Uncharacterized protein n=1 Tax=Phlebia brevispora TaxID=194682 RepID=A0ACC1TB80_9APHY|nr:hypothetical protein NM688_g1644 [Phlebia brevispora]